MILALLILSSVITGVVCGFAIYNDAKGRWPCIHDPRTDSAMAVSLGLLYGLLLPIIGIVLAAFLTRWFRHGIFKFKP